MVALRLPLASDMTTGSPWLDGPPKLAAGSLLIADAMARAGRPCAWPPGSMRTAAEAGEVRAAIAAHATAAIEIWGECLMGGDSSRPGPATSAPRCRIDPPRPPGGPPSVLDDLAHPARAHSHRHGGELALDPVLAFAAHDARHHAAAVQYHGVDDVGGGVRVLGPNDSRAREQRGLAHRGRRVAGDHDDRVWSAVADGPEQPVTGLRQHNDRRPRDVLVAVHLDHVGVVALRQRPSQL